MDRGMNRTALRFAVSLIIWAASLSLSIYASAIPAFSAISDKAELEISAKSAVVMDRQSRRVLYEKNTHEILPMASTTKIMTAIIALEAGSEDDLVVVSREAAGTEGSSIWLEKGEEKTLRELLYGLIMQSGNDAAVAIAEHLAGSVEGFAHLMNEKALDIGAVNTRFTNPHGLHDENHYTTAYDMALITSYALENPRFREIIATPLYTISWPGHEWDRVIGNQNRLLELYPGGDGVKTGWTDEAGRCFVGSATRDGWQLVAVELNAPQMWEDVVLLLDYGYASYNNERIVEEGQLLRSIPVAKGRKNLELAAARDFYYPLEEGEDKLIHYRFALNEAISAPISAGEVVGELVVFLDEIQIGTVDLQSACAVERKPIGFYLLELWHAFCR